VPAPAEAAASREIDAVVLLFVAMIVQRLRPCKVILLSCGRDGLVGRAVWTGDCGGHEREAEEK
jgi:hypothetical protein